MLDAYIIEEIKRREREREQRERARPVVHIPRPDEDRRSERDEPPESGTVIQVDL